MPVMPMCQLTISGNFPAEGPITIQPNQILAREEGGLYGEIENKGYYIPSNPKVGHSFLSRLIDWIEEDHWFRGPQSVDKTYKLWVEATGDSLGKGTQNFVSACRTCWTFSAIGAAPPLIKKAFNAWGKVDKKSCQLPGEHERKVDKAWKETFDATATTLYGLGSGLGCIPGTEVLTKQILFAADSFDAGKGFSEIHMALQDYQRATNLKTLAEKTQDAEHLAPSFNEKARYSLLVAAKAVCTVAGFIFMAFLAVTGAHLLPPIVALTVSLAGTLFAISKPLYLSGMSAGEVDFFDQKQVRILPEPTTV